MLRSALPIVLCCLLVALSFARVGLIQEYREAQSTHRRLLFAQARLQRAKEREIVAGQQERNYKDLIREVAALTGLDHRTEAVSKGESTVQASRFIDAAAVALKSEEFQRLLDLREVKEDQRLLQFKNVTPGRRQEFPPFTSVEFEIHLEGRFQPLPVFLRLLATIAEKDNSAMSVGELRLDLLKGATDPGTLSITVPVRAYFYEE